MRETLIQQFLASAGLGSAQRIALPSDASFRHYERIKNGEKNFILMNAPPPKEDVRPFVRIAVFLEKNGFSTPHIFSEDTENGFLLLEDFGSALYTAILDGNHTTSLEDEIYRRAADVLVALHKITPPDFPAAYDNALLLREVKLFTEWYLPYAEIELSEKAKTEYEEILLTLFPYLKKQKPVLVLRDYHADNLIYLSEREGYKKVGLLDFQDAVIGSPAYDLVSLLEDARRDVPPALREKILDYYLSLNLDTDAENFRACYSILGAQRNLKIIGIFTRLAVRDGKKRYLYFLPRVWKHLENDFQHPVLAPLKTWLDENIPVGKIRNENR